jgi:hypothetical protein
VSGWADPSAAAGSSGGTGGAGGPVAWVAPEETPGLGVRQLIDGAWRLYRAAGRRLLMVAAVPALVQALLALPGLAIGLGAMEAMLRLFGDFSRFGRNPAAFQAEIQAAMRPATDLLVIAGVAGGLSMAISIIGWGAITAAALAASEGRPVTIGSAFRVVLAHRSAIVIPALLVGLAWGLVTVVQAAVTPTGPVLPTPAQTALYSLFGLLVGVVTLVVFILAIVLSLALPAILAEDLGLRRGLARGAALTRGIRMRLGLAFIAVAILQGLSVGIIGGIAAIAGGLIAASLQVGIVIYLVITLIGALLWLPFLPSMLVVAYRDRLAHAADAGRDDGAPDVATGAGVDRATSVIDAG